MFDSLLELSPFRGCGSSGKNLYESKSGSLARSIFSEATQRQPQVTYSFAVQ
jgi:hypothetical protein